MQAVAWSGRSLLVKDVVIEGSGEVLQEGGVPSVCASEVPHRAVGVEVTGQHAILFCRWVSSHKAFSAGL